MMDHDKPVLSWLNFTSKSPKLADVGLWLKSRNLVELNQIGVTIFIIIIPTLPIRYILLNDLMKTKSKNDQS